jgi:hypothetical protein
LIAVRFTLAFILLTLLMTGCHRRDVTLSQQIAGTWTHEGGFSMTIAPDSSFSSSFISSNHVVVLEYQGTWLVTNETMVATITNATGTRRHESVGSVDRMKITRVDKHQLVFEAENQTIISLSR